MALVCTLCRFEIESDDAVQGTVTPQGRAICVRCYAREVQDERRMSTALRRDVTRAADGG